jgi:hypothetical protein
MEPRPSPNHRTVAKLVLACAAAGLLLASVTEATPALAAVDTTDTSIVTDVADAPDVAALVLGSPSADPDSVSSTAPSRATFLPQTLTCLQTQTTCLQVMPVARRLTTAQLSAQVAHATAALPPTIVAYPSWCVSVPDRVTIGLRNSACRPDTVEIDVTRVVGGVPTLVGYMFASTIEWHYGNPARTNIVSQMGLAPFFGQGEYTGISVSGVPASRPGCTAGASSFPSQGLTLNTGYKSGAAEFVSTATATGARAICNARWTLTFTKVGATSGSGNFDFGVFRCDNAIINKAPGCVVPWAAEVMTFSSAKNPNLVTHIRKAQQSGLPGAVNVSTLTRTTNATIASTNYSRACSGKPSVTGKSCDEYPFKTSTQGLASIPDWQNWRRSFTGCSWNALVNGQTGAKGVSVCMVPVEEQQSQGGIVGGFYKSWRVLNADPFYVFVS